MTKITGFKRIAKLSALFFLVALIGFAGFGCDSSDVKPKEDTPVLQEQADGDSVNTQENAANAPSPSDVESSDPSGTDTPEASNNPGDTGSSGPQTTENSPPPTAPTQGNPASNPEDTDQPVETPVDNLSGNNAGADTPAETGGTTADNPPPSESPTPNETPPVVPVNKNAKIKISVKTESNTNGQFENIWLDIREVQACGIGGCQIAGGAKRIDLLDKSVNAVDLLDGLMPEGNVNQLRFVLGNNNAVVVNGQSHPLTVPGGDSSGLKLTWNGNLKQGDLNHILIDFEPENAVKQTANGYVLDPVIKIAASITAPETAQTSVINPKNGGSLNVGNGFTLSVPAGSTQTSGIVWSDANSNNPITPLYTLGPEGTVFNDPVKVRLAYDPAQVPEDYPENELVILHDGVPIETTVNTELKTVEGEIGHFSTVTVGKQFRAAPWATLVFVDDIQMPPDYVYPGQRVTAIWSLYNRSSLDAVNYRLAEETTNYADGQTRFSPFTILAGETRSASVVEFPAPMTEGFYQIYFDILDTDGDVVDPLSLGKLYFNFTVDPGLTPTPDPDPTPPPDPDPTPSPDPDPTPPPDPDSTPTPEPEPTPVDCTRQAVLVYQSMVQDVPPDVAPGQSVTVVFSLQNQSGIDATDYTLAEYGSNYGVGASYPPFTINSSQTGSALMVNFPAPPEPARVYFDLVDTCGNVLPALSGGRMWIEFAGSGYCTDPSPPPSAHVWQNGSGLTGVTIPAGEDSAMSYELQFNDDAYPMSMMDDETNYGASAENPASGYNSIKVSGSNACGSVAFPSNGNLNVTNSNSGYYGSYTYDSWCEKFNGNQGDPVNTAIGNFVYDETDAIVAGLGGTTIRMTRYYNSQAALWTPASIKEYTETEDGEIEEEVVAGPPQYFGSGWTSVLGQYLLVVDMAPIFEGVQVLYPDGHTALFSKNGDTFTSESPANFDEITLEGDEYVLRNNDCKCSLDSKRFSADGKLVAISDRNGNEIRLTYDGDNLASVENASGRRIAFSSDGDGRIISASLPEGITLQYGYTDGMLTAFTDGRGNQTQYRYDDKGQMTETVTPKGHSAVRVEYDEDGRAVSQIVGETEKYDFVYEDDGSCTTVTDAYGNSRVHQYDGEKRLVQIDHPDGSTELFEYDDDFKRTYYRDQGGAEWRWTYDDKGNRLTANGPLGWHREWEYNDKNQVTRMSENVDAATVRTTTFEYDERGNLVRFCNPLGGCGSVVYDSLGQPLTMTDFAGNTTAHVFDGEGDLVTVTDAEGAVSSFNHDGLGRVAGMVRPLGNSYTYIYDENSNMTGVNGPLGFHIGFAFDANDNLASKTDPNGGNIDYDYNASDRIMKIVNQLQFDTATYAYGLMNEVAGVTDAEGRTWNYAYDDMLRVSDVNGPLGVHFGYEYNAVGKITDFTDANGIVTHTGYDALYRPLSVVRNFRPVAAPNADTNVTVSYEWNLVGQMLRMVDPEGFATQFAYDLSGRRVGKTDAEGHVWSYEYDPMGNILRMLNPRGFASQFEYTPTYRIRSAVNPESHAVGYLYDANGNLTRITDPKTVVTHFEYDELDRRVGKTRNFLPGATPDSETNVAVQYAYDLAGNLRHLTNPRNYEAEFVYDAAHRRTDIIDFEQGRTRFAYDRVNNLLTVTDANGNATNYAYDDLNRLVEILNAENEAKAFEYDPMGNRTHLIEADGTVTLYGYDAIYRLNQVTQNYRNGLPANNDTNVATNYAYDARGLLLEILNANGAATAFDYNAVGRMVRETDPLNNVWTYAYDGQGNRTARVDANGDRTEYAYYPDDMLEEIRYANGQVVSYTYDPNNNRTRMTDWLGQTDWDYDPLNRVVRADDPFSRVLAYAYDAASNRTEMTYPDGNRVGYGFSPNNWMADVTDPENGQTAYTRDRVGNVLHIANPNHTETETTYDRVYRTLTHVNRQTTGEQKLHTAFDYTYNVLGHVTQAVKEYGWRNPPTVTETYTYDGLHRLAGAVIDPIKNNGEKEIMAYEYDAVGNRMRMESLNGLSTSTLTDGFTKTYAYNAANQLLSVNTDSVKKNPNINLIDTYTYDANGNRVNRLSVDENDKNALVEGMDYAFDPENRLIQALKYQLGGKDQTVRTDRAVTDLEYDGGGRRLAKHYDPKSNAAQGVDKEVQYVFDGLDPVAEYEMLNGQRENFYRGAMGRIITMHHFNSGAPGQMYWYHYNFKGDVAGLTKHNGNSHHTYRYDPYGGVVPENGNFTDPHNHYTLTGKEYDENMGLVWFGARHYDPGVGVWVTQDVYRGSLAYPQTIHRYNFIHNNPVNYSDQWGFWATGAWGSDTVHQNAIKATFGKSLTDDQLKFLNEGQVFADSDENQDPEDSPQHAMRGIVNGKEQTKEDAKNSANKFVRDQFNEAWRLKVEGKENDALYQFSIGLHALQDWTSPAHNDFQLWSGSTDIVSHYPKENFSPGEGSELYRITRDAWNWYNNGKDCFPFKQDDNIFKGYNADKRPTPPPRKPFNEVIREEANNAWDATKEERQWAGEQAGKAIDATKKVGQWAGEQAGKAIDATIKTGQWFGEQAGKTFQDINNAFQK